MIRIKREYNKDYTLGTLTSDEFREILYCVELPYLDNKNQISCIPAGEYKIKKYYSNKFKNCFKILNVKDRTNVLIHSGNTVNAFKDSTGYNWKVESHGCLLVCLSINRQEQYPIGKFSHKALEFLLEHLEDTDYLIIE